MLCILLLLILLFEKYRFSLQSSFCRFVSLSLPLAYTVRLLCPFSSLSTSFVCSFSRCSDSYLQGLTSTAVATYFYSALKFMAALVNVKNGTDMAEYECSFEQLIFSSISENLQPQVFSYMSFCSIGSFFSISSSSTIDDLLRTWFTNWLTQQHRAIRQTLFVKHSKNNNGAVIKNEIIVGRMRCGQYIFGIYTTYIQTIGRCYAPPSVSPINET